MRNLILRLAGVFLLALVIFVVGHNSGINEADKRWQTKQVQLREQGFKAFEQLSEETAKVQLEWKKENEKIYADYIDAVNSVERVHIAAECKPTSSSASAEPARPQSAVLPQPVDQMLSAMEYNARRLHSDYNQCRQRLRQLENYINDNAPK